MMLLDYLPKDRTSVRCPWLRTYSRRLGRLALLSFLTLSICGSLASDRPPPRGKPVPTTDWSHDVLYFVVLDRFADGDPGNNRDVDIQAKGTFHGGDLVGLTRQLDELAELGITAVWITPVVKNIDHYVDGVGFPDWGYHGYWADDFYRIDDRFGTEAELKKLVDEAHRRGIKVVLDVVYNHCGYGAAYLKKDHANDWLRTGRRESPCGDDDLTSCLSGLPDFKTERAEVADYLMKAHLGLAKRVGLDGFRLDTVKHVDHPFWREHRARCDRELGESFFLLGEVWGGDYKVLDDWFEHDEMDGGFDFSFVGSALAFVQGRGRTIAFSRYLMKRHRVRPGYQLAHYLSSHDVPGALFQLGGDKARFKLLVALQLTSVGLPTIYYGEEVGRLGGDWPDNRSDMPWGSRDIKPGKGVARDEDMRRFYRELIRLRREYPVLAVGGYQELHTAGDPLVFARTPAEGDATSKGPVVVAVNRGKVPAPAVVPKPESWTKPAARGLLSGAPVEVADGKLHFAVPPLGARVIAGRD